MIHLPVITLGRLLLDWSADVDDDLLRWDYGFPTLSADDDREEDEDE
jgi:hypothetical protein